MTGLHFGAPPNTGNYHAFKMRERIDLSAHFAERDRWFRESVTDAGMLHG